MTRREHRADILQAASNSQGYENQFYHCENRLFSVMYWTPQNPQTSAQVYCRGDEGLSNGYTPHARPFIPCSQAHPTPSPCRNCEASPAQGCRPLCMLHDQLQKPRATVPQAPAFMQHSHTRMSLWRRIPPELHHPAATPGFPVS